MLYSTILTKLVRIVAFWTTREKKVSHHSPANSEETLSYNRAGHHAK